MYFYFDKQYDIDEINVLENYHNIVNEIMSKKIIDVIRKTEGATRYIPPTEPKQSESMKEDNSELIKGVSSLQGGMIRAHRTNF